MQEIKNRLAVHEREEIGIVVEFVVVECVVVERMIVEPMVVDDTATFILILIRYVRKI